jgi:hypothetical protein
MDVDGLPINSMVIFHGELLNNQMVDGIFPIQTSIYRGFPLAMFDYSGGMPFFERLSKLQMLVSKTIHYNKGCQWNPKRGIFHSCNGH